MSFLAGCSFSPLTINVSPLRPVNNSKEGVARMILDYLRKNPDAGDSLEGISRWWLNREKIDVTVGEISEILETLIMEGKVRRTKDEGSNSIYKLLEE